MEAMGAGIRIMIKIAKTVKEVGKCYSVMNQLRDITLSDFHAGVARQKARYGYKLAYIESEGKVVAVAGFRISHCLSWGKYMYIDDLITDQYYRSEGFGDALMNFLIQLAKDKKCNQLHLDSGVQRFDAHRFYLKNRMAIIAHHFALLEL